MYEKLGRNALQCTYFFVIEFEDNKVGVERTQP
jgi:hypothetical protein